jgi:hypothetical protein
MPDLEFTNRIVGRIKERLQPLESELKVKVANNTQQAVGVDMAAFVVVAYIGSTWSAPASPFSQIEILRELKFQLNLFVRDPRTDEQVPRIEAAIIHLLTGYQPICHEGSLYPLKSQLQGPPENGLYNFPLVFGMQAYQQQGGDRLENL